ncbi:MAG: ABC transporter permease, partial [Gemmatimonadaceae bacterium]
MPNSKDPKRPDLPSRSSKRIAADVRDELQGWIDERTLDLVRSGVAPADARARAHTEFGDLPTTHARIVADEQMTEREKRLTRWIGELRADSRAAFRLARRTPLASGVLIITFALGIGATTAIYSAVHALLVRPLPYAREGTLLQVAPTDRGVRAPGEQISADAFLTLRSRTTTLAGIAGMSYGGAAITGDGDPELVRGARLTANFFSVAGVTTAAGRPFVDGDDAPGAEPIAVISDRLWLRRYGRDRAIVGKKIEANGKLRRVVGVTPPGFAVPTMPEAELFTPLDLTELRSDPDRMRKFRFMRAIARLKDNTPPISAQRDVDAVFARLGAEDAGAYSGFSAKLVPVREAITGTLRPALLVLMGAALTVLLIACANITVVLLTRTMSREHELAVRAALGAGRARLARQLLVESLTLAAVGGIAGIALSALLLRLLSVVGASSLPPGTELSLDAPVLGFALALTALSGLAFGLAPALLGGGNVGRLLATLSARATSSRLRGSFRALLVGGQLALSVALLLSAALLVRSLHNLSTIDLGFRTEQVLSFDVSLPGARYKDDEAEDRFWDALMPQIRSIAGVV